MNIAKSSIKLFVSKGATSVIGFVAIAYFSNKIGPSSMGVFFLFQALLGMLSIPTDMGLRGAAQKRISEGNDPGKYLSSAIALKIIPLVITLVFIFIFSSHINDYLGGNLTALLAVSLIFQELAQLSVFVLRGELRVDETAILNIAKKMTWAIVSAVLLILGYKSDGLIYGLLIGSIIMLAMGWYKVSISPGLPSISHARSLFNYSRYNVITSIGGSIFSWVDIIVIGILLTQSDVGAYEVAWRVAGITVLLGTAIGDTLLPQVSQWSNEQATSKIETAIHNTVTPSVMLVIPSFFGVILFSNEILGFIFGPEFAKSGVVLIVLMAGKISQSFLIILSRVIMGMNHPEIAAKATIIAAFTNIILNFIFVLQFGLVGAAIATAVSTGLNTIVHGYQLSKFVRIEIPYREIGWCIFAALGMTASLLVFEDLVPITGLVTLFAAVLFGSLVYFGIVLTSPNLRTKLRVLLDGGLSMRSQQ